MNHIIYIGDVLKALKLLPDNSVDMCITSPPYLGLRAYGHDGQIGLEPTIDDYLKKMLEVTIEVKRVIKKAGSFWLNMGDCFGAGARKTNVPDTINKKRGLTGLPEKHRNQGYAKCLLMMPERLAVAMIDKQGWTLRNKIKWVKQILIEKRNKTIGSAMPTSVADRFNETSEELYLFTKSKKYYFDIDSVRVPCQVQGVTDLRENGFLRAKKFEYDSKYLAEYSSMAKQSGQRFDYKGKFEGTEDAESFNSPRARSQRASKRADRGDTGGRWGNDGNGMAMPTKYNNPKGKNIPNCWQINTEPRNFKKELGVDVDHFAAFPSALIRRPILVGCPEGGTVLDIFAGSGTVAVVSELLKRNSIGIELNPKYVQIIKKRLGKLNNFLFKVEVEEIIVP